MRRGCHLGDDLDETLHTELGMLPAVLGVYKARLDVVTGRGSARQRTRSRKSRSEPASGKALLPRDWPPPGGPTGPERPDQADQTNPTRRSRPDEPDGRSRPGEGGPSAPHGVALGMYAKSSGGCGAW